MLKKILIPAALLIMLGGIPACNSDNDEGLPPLLTLSALVAVGNSSSCSGGAPEVTFVNGNTTGTYTYEIFTSADCGAGGGDAAITTTNALAPGESQARVCVNLSAAGSIRVQGGNCSAPFNLFRGKKQTATHTRTGGVDSFNVVSQ